MSLGVVVLLFGKTIDANIPRWEKISTHPDAAFAEEDHRCRQKARQYSADNADDYGHLFPGGRDWEMEKFIAARCGDELREELMAKYPEQTKWVRYYISPNTGNKVFR